MLIIVSFYIDERAYYDLLIITGRYQQIATKTQSNDVLGKCGKVCYHKAIGIE